MLRAREWPREGPQLRNACLARTPMATRKTVSLQCLARTRRAMRRIASVPGNIALCFRRFLSKEIRRKRSCFAGRPVRRIETGESCVAGHFEVLS